jgi:undecaprenyl-diphosphatase
VAAVIGFSRIYIGVHYPLDVVFGAAVGILSALLVLKIGDNILVDQMSRECLKEKLPYN